LIDSGSSPVTGYHDLAKLALAVERELHRDSFREVLLTFV